MKKELLFLAFACLVGGITTVTAAESNEGVITEKDRQELTQKAELRRQKRIEKLTKELNLSKEQADKVSQIIKAGWEKIRVERDKMREITKQIRQDTDAQIEKLLSPEQLEKFKKHIRKERENFKKRFNKWNKHHSGLEE
jgi:Spy/CpxP family protein refolding chaperone